MPPNELYMDFGQIMFQATLVREANVNEPFSPYDAVNSPIAVLPVSRHLTFTALVSYDAQHGAFGLIELLLTRLSRLDAWCTVPDLCEPRC